MAVIDSQHDLIAQTEFFTTPVLFHDYIYINGLSDTTGREYRRE